MKKCRRMPAGCRCIPLSGTRHVCARDMVFNLPLSHPGDFSESEHQEFFLGLLMYFGAAALLIYSTLQSMGNQVEYDDFSLIFRFRRGEERVFSWNELPQKAQLRRVATGLKIRFADDERECFLSSTMYGFRKFLRVLRDRGLVP